MRLNRIRLVRLRVAPLLILTLVLASRAASADQILWTSNGANNDPEIKRANVDGTNIQAVLPARQSTNVLSLAIDSRDGWMYYGRWAADYSIYRRPIDGGSESLVYDLHALDVFQPSGGNNEATPWGLSIDTVHNKLYWSAGENPSHSSAVNVTTFIQRSNLDGTNVELLRQGTSNTFSPIGIVVDGASQKLYWFDFATDSIRSSNLDGTGVQNVVTGAIDPMALAIDFDDQRLFWTEPSVSGQGRVRTANLDGSGVQTVVSAGLLQTTGVAVDSIHNLLYMTDDHFQGTGRILQSNYDGTNLQELITQQPRAWAIALYSPVPEPSTWALVCGTLPIAVFVLRRRRSTPATCSP